MHRNTLVYRLEKIKKLTGLDLRKFDDAIVFKVALMVKSIFPLTLPVTKISYKRFFRAPLLGGRVFCCRFAGREDERISGMQENKTEG